MIGSPLPALAGLTCIQDSVVSLVIAHSVYLRTNPTHSCSFPSLPGNSASPHLGEAPSTRRLHQLPVCDKALRRVLAGGQASFVWVSEVPHKAEDSMAGGCGGSEQRVQWGSSEDRRAGVPQLAPPPAAVHLGPMWWAVSPSSRVVSSSACHPTWHPGATLADTAEVCLEFSGCFPI